MRKRRKPREVDSSLTSSEIITVEETVDYFCHFPYMQRTLQGKRVLITGAPSGIGREIATALAEAERGN